MENVGEKECKSRLCPSTWAYCGQANSFQHSFHCLFCHGYEERGQESAGVLAVEDLAVPGPAMHVARMARRFATTVTIYTHGVSGITKKLEEAAHGTGIKVDSRPILRLTKGSDGSEVEITFEDGTRRTEGFLVSWHSLPYGTYNPTAF